VWFGLPTKWLYTDRGLNFFIEAEPVTMQIGESRTLEDILIHLDTIGNDMVIYVTTRSDWTPSTPAKLIRDPDSHALQLGDLTYFLEVSTAKELVEGWRKTHNRQWPSFAEKMAMIIHYAIYDA
jgi:hypothetical protein